MMLLRNKQHVSCESAKVCYICKKLECKYARDEIMIKLGIIVIIQVNIEMLHI